jgi:hypothetical protein
MLESLRRGMGIEGAPPPAPMAAILAVMDEAGVLFLSGNARRVFGVE